jgi:hypothetical protein
MTNYATIGRHASGPQPTQAERDAAAKAELVEALAEGRTTDRERYLRDNYEDELSERIPSLHIYMAAIVTGSTVARDGLRAVMEQAARAAVASGWESYCRHCAALDAEEAEGAW